MNIIRKLKEKREMVHNLQEDIEDLESDLMGMEIEVDGHYAVISFVDTMNDQVIIYCDAGEEGEWDESLTFEELEELL